MFSEIFAIKNDLYIIKPTLPVSRYKNEYEKIGPKGPILSVIGVGNHNIDDLLVGLGHAVFGQAAHIFNGILHTLGDDAVAAVELLMLPVHIPAQDTGIHRCGNFRRA